MLALGLLLDHDVVEEPPARPEHLRDGLAEQAEVVLLEPLVVEPARELDRQLGQALVVLEPDGRERLEPRLEALPADVVPDDGETRVPDRCRGGFRLDVSGRLGGVVHAGRERASGVGGRAGRASLPHRGARGGGAESAGPEQQIGASENRGRAGSRASSPTMRRRVIHKWGGAAVWLKQRTDGLTRYYAFYPHFINRFIDVTNSSASGS